VAVGEQRGRLPRAALHIGQISDLCSKIHKALGLHIGYKNFESWHSGVVTELNV